MSIDYSRLPRPQDGKAWQERIHDDTRPMTAPPKEKKE